MKKNSPRVLPVIPLADTVIFPGITSPVITVRKISRIAVDQSISNYNRKVVVATQKTPELDSATSSNLYKVGVLAEISSVIPISDDAVRCNIRGLERVHIADFTLKSGTIFAHYSKTKGTDSDRSLDGIVRTKLLNLYEEYVMKNPLITEEFISLARNIKDIKETINFIASNSFIPVESKIKILKTKDLQKQFFLLLEMLRTEIELRDMQDNINKKVKERLEKNQKEFFLNEQLKIIRKELGKEEDERIHKLREQMENKKLPENIENRVKEEMERLKKIPSISPEFGVLYNYVEWLLRLPWTKSIQNEVDLEKTKKILDKNHYGLLDIKERVLEYLSVLKLKGGGVGHILCFLGPAGVGKTSLGRSIAEALGRSFVRASLGGIKDEAEIRGHRRTYVGSMPGKIIQKMASAGIKNPVFLLDEIDKIGQDFRGDPSSALLEVLDPEVNHEFNDHYIEEGFDLSEVLFITTANATYTIPPTLLDRMETIHLPGYLEHEKVEIATNYLIPKVLKESGLKKGQLHIFRPVLHKLVTEYSREAGVRELERLLIRLSQKAAKEIAFEGKKKVKVTKRNLKNYLGVPKFNIYKKRQDGRIGVANGLAVTRNGGEVIQVEARTMEGSGELTLTGQLGEVMQESAKAALSLIRSNHKNYGLDKNFYKKIDLHIHVPEGAVPKDGPSAGITIFSAILSALTGKPAKGNLAMTGEITLSGDILPIGGLREKLVAAQSANFKEVILPAENKAEIDSYGSEIKRGLKLIFVEDTTKVVKYIFPK